MGSEKRCAPADRMVKTEIEAAETLADLAHLAMTTRFTPHSPTPPHSRAKLSTTSPKPVVETESISQDDCLSHMKVEQDLPTTTTTYSLGRCSSKSRRILTEEEKEARRIRRVLANRESARQTIRRRQALCEELTRKAANLARENQNLKREKEMALKEYQSLETTNKHLKAQIAKSINTKVEKTPVEQETSVAGVTTLSGNGPWFLYNRFPVTQLFWPSIIQSSNPVQLQHTPFNSITIPPNVSVPCSSESDSCHQQNNLINNNPIQNPLYMFPYPWLFPPPEFGSGQPPPSIGLKDKQGEIPLGKQCSSSSSLSTVANLDHQAALPIKLKTEASGWTEARTINVEPGHSTTRFPLDGASHIATSSLEKKQARFICPGTNLVDAVAAATEARKKRKELTKLKSIHNRQFGTHC